jgi:hypothetical protein
VSGPPSIVNGVNDSIRHAQIEPRDRGTVVLAKRYAALLDEAAIPQSYAEALHHLGTLVVDEVGRRHLQRIAAALSEHSVTSDLGPKLLAALTALGCNPGARVPVKGGNSGAPVPGGPADELAKLRDSHQQRGGPR